MTEMTGDREAPLLQVDDLAVHYSHKGEEPVRALDGVSFSLRAGEALAIVGESGCGKSTLARALVRLVQPTRGQVLLDGDRIDDLPEKAFRSLRPRIQMVFQDPYGSLDPHQTVEAIVTEPLRLHARAGAGARRERLGELLDLVGLDKGVTTRRPAELSGGQRQRVGIARALALRPDVLICDEATSALDVSVQAQILALLSDLRKDLGLSLVIISHSLGVVRHGCQRILVMYSGRIVERGAIAEIFESSAHPYTKALIKSAPDATATVPKQRLSVLNEGDLRVSAGCALQARCPLVVDRCLSKRRNSKP